MLAAAWTTWAMALSEVANAWWGTAQLLRIAAGEAGVSGGAPWQEQMVALPKVATDLPLIVAWALLILGFLRQEPLTDSNPS